MEFLSEYGMFLAKVVTIVIALIVIVAAIASAGQKNKKHFEGHIEVNNLSEEIQEVKEGMLKELLSDEEFKELAKQKRKEEKAEQKKNKEKAKALAKSAKKSKSSVEELADEQAQETKEKPESESDVAESPDDQETDIDTPDKDGAKMFVLNFEGDVEASDVENLREEITAIITSANKQDKVLVRLESPGGLVHAYGLAASQLSRIKEAGLELIVAVDQVAASGGYMMACVADKIIAAPFAVVGSIGVVAEIPNFHRLLKHNKVDYEQHTAGEYKRTLTMFAENTDAAREKFKQELEETHVLFKQFITANRPDLNIEKVATGEHWYGTQALELGLIDEVKTSDDYIISTSDDMDVFEITYRVKRPLAERFSFSVQSAMERVLMSLWQKHIQSRLFRS
ncbi:protease SohB [Aliikangiella sp. G2MR2-5]|uniref:protease SohB n=1 Tax=Aliikangiella sp. G2MR2-5 TaxID=2788943 RepID=UPI0018A9DB41|nr:protease SohB [Aliikangiella sp. G2MR2-5]